MTRGTKAAVPRVDFRTHLPSMVMTGVQVRGLGAEAARQSWPQVQTTGVRGARLKGRRPLLSKRVPRSATIPGARGRDASGFSASTKAIPSEG